MIDLDEISQAISGQYDARVEMHVKICVELFSVPRAARAYRAETSAESSKRHYWSQKMGRKISKLEFWTAAPKLLTGAIIVGSVAEAERAFLKEAKAPVARRYVHKNAKKKSRTKIDTVYLKPRDFIRVRVLASGQHGVITAYGVEGYRVTIDPKVSWKRKFRRWLCETDFQVIDGKELPNAGNYS